MGKVEQSVEVNAPVSECYAMWTDFENFPRFMKHIRQIRRKGSENILHWEVDGPLGKTVEWDAEIVGMQPNQLVSWRSVRNAHVSNSGAVVFESLGDNRTRLNVTMVYDPPAGAVGEFVADIFQNPIAMVREDLENFKKLVEQSSSHVGKASSRAQELSGGGYHADLDTPRASGGFSHSDLRNSGLDQELAQEDLDRPLGGLDRERRGGTFAPGEMPNDI